MNLQCIRESDDGMRKYAMCMNKQGSQSFKLYSQTLIDNDISQEDIIIQLLYLLQSMGKCKKCGCSGFTWNPVSAGQKFFSGSQTTINTGKYGFQTTIKGMPSQDNKSDQVAYRNCTCGHHANYH